MWLWFRLGSQVHYFCQLERQSKEDTARSSFCICHHWRCWSRGWQGVTPRHVLGSLRNDDRNSNDNDNDNDNAINQWYDGLNEEKKSCCTCGTLFGAIFWRSLPNDDLKFCTTWPAGKNCKTQLNLWRSRLLFNLTCGVLVCSSRRSFLNSLLKSPCS